MSPAFAGCHDAACVQSRADFGLPSIDLFLFWKRYIFLNTGNGQLQIREVAQNLSGSSS